MTKKKLERRRVAVLCRDEEGRAPTICRQVRVRLGLQEELERRRNLSQHFLSLPEGIREDWDDDIAEQREMMANMLPLEETVDTLVAEAIRAAREA